MTFEENSDGTLTAATGLATLPGPSDPKATLVHWNNTLVNLSGTIYIYGSLELELLLERIVGARSKQGDPD